ncbi:MAG: DUF885 family protein [Hyphomonadaceae bacterium]
MIMTRRALLSASAAGLALAAGCAPTTTESGLAPILDQLAIDMLRESPEYATSLAVSEEQAGGRYIDRVSDFSKAGRRRSQAISENALTQLRALGRDGLSHEDAITYDVVVTSLENDVAAGRFEFGGGATSPYNVTQLTGAYAYFPDFLASRHPLTNREQAEAYLARLALFAGGLDQESANIAEDAAAGVIQPDFTIDGATRQLSNFAARPPAETVLVTALRDHLAEIEDISDADKAAMVERAEAIVRDEVMPAYQRQIEALTAIRPRATHDAGVWRLPDGGDIYAAALRSYTTTSMTPDEIHEMGVELVAQMQSEMDAIFRSQGMTSGTVNDRVRALGRRPDQVYPSTDEGRARLLADLNAQMAAITARMPEVCGVLAQAALEIKRVPEFTEAGAPGGYYQGAALDGSRPGAYYINLRAPATEWPKFKLPTLTYHEGTPGHHWQISIQQESGSIPFIRSALMGFSAFSEGWGLYAEQLADEMGMYENDPFGRIGYLQSAAFRASRLVVDTGLHAKRWSREQAIDSMMAATGDVRTSVVTEIERYCVWPGQACSYMVGRQALNRMRDEARASMGDRFDIRGFHDTVLTAGSAPLSVTESLVRAWATPTA